MDDHRSRDAWRPGERGLRDQRGRPDRRVERRPWLRPAEQAPAPSRRSRQRHQRARPGDRVLLRGRPAAGLRLERGKRRALANLGGSCAKSMPAAINARGHVVGWAGDMENCSLSLTLAWTALLWQGSAKAQLAEFDSQAVAINSRGQVAGNREWGLAFLWHKGRMQSLGALSSQGGSRATAMNERGQVVGSSYAAGLARRAFIWHDGKMRSLGTLGGKESSVDGIARRGDFNFNTSIPRRSTSSGRSSARARREPRSGMVSSGSRAGCETSARSAARRAVPSRSTSVGR